MSLSDEYEKQTDQSMFTPYPKRSKDIGNLQIKLNTIKPGAQITNTVTPINEFKTNIPIDVKIKIPRQSKIFGIDLKK